MINIKCRQRLISLSRDWHSLTESFVFFSKYSSFAGIRNLEPIKVGSRNWMNSLQIEKNVQYISGLLLLNSNLGPLTPSNWMLPSIIILLGRSIRYMCIVKRRGQIVIFDESWKHLKVKDLSSKSKIAVSWDFELNKSAFIRFYQIKRGGGVL